MRISHENKGTVINPMSVQEIQDKFGGRGPISDAFGNAAEDLAEAFARVNPQILEGIFKNGRVFANIQYPVGSVVIDPWRYIPNADGVKVIHVGRPN